MADQKKIVIFDTDIGPDCDDVGALMMLLHMEQAGLCRLAAITHSTSSPFGCGCADAICRAEGRADIPIGTLKRGGVCCRFADGRYNEVISGLYQHRFSDGTEAPDAVRVIRKAMAENDEVLLIAVGPLGNIADFLQSGPDDLSPLSGVELARAKCPRFVCMGGMLSGNRREFNFIVEPDATRTVLSQWPTEIEFSEFFLGEDVVTGATLSQTLGRLHPAALAYALYSPQGRASFDQTAVYQAIFPENKLFRASERGRMSLGENDTTVWTADPLGKHRWYDKAADKETIAAEIDAWMLKRA